VNILSLRTSYLVSVEGKVKGLRFHTLNSAMQAFHDDSGETFMMLGKTFHHGLDVAIPHYLPRAGVYIRLELAI
jgi:hypothetical protein